MRHRTRESRAALDHPRPVGRPPDRSPSSKETAMAERRIGIIVNGATGRMGYRQHLVRSLLAIRDQGGVALADGDRLMPDLLLRSEERRVGKKCKACGD